MDLTGQDFHSPDGLFSMTKGTRVNKTALKDLFDGSYLQSSDAFSVWLKSMAELWEKVAEAMISRTHGFLWVLQCIYTQNINGLEDQVGIPSVESPYHKVILGGHVKFHGSLTTLQCMSCSSTRFFTKGFMKDLENGKVPD